MRTIESSHKQKLKTWNDSSGVNFTRIPGIWPTYDRFTSCYYFGYWDKVNKCYIDVNWDTENPFEEPKDCVQHLMDLLITILIPVGKKKCRIVNITKSNPQIFGFVPKIGQMTNKNTSLKMLEFVKNLEEKQNSPNKNEKRSTTVR